MTDKCKAEVWRKDTYRYTGRTKSRFELHYNRGQCSRNAVKDGLCYQHQPNYWEVVLKRNQERRHRNNRIRAYDEMERLKQYSRQQEEQS